MCWYTFTNNLNPIVGIDLDVDVVSLEDMISLKDVVSSVNIISPFIEAFFGFNLAFNTITRMIPKKTWIFNPKIFNLEKIKIQVYKVD